jgi:hypothetical protein
MLRKRGINAVIKPPCPENTAELNRQLHEDEDIPMPEQPEPPATTRHSRGRSRQRVVSSESKSKRIMDILKNRPQTDTVGAAGEMVSYPNGREPPHRVRKIGLSG